MKSWLRFSIMMIIGNSQGLPGDAVLASSSESSGSVTPSGTFNSDGTAVTYPLGQVYYEGSKFNYVDFGKRSAAYGFDIHPSPIWILVSGFDQAGRPLLLDGQRVIFDHLPGETDYSDLKRVNYIVVPSNYQTNSHTDARAIRNGFDSSTQAAATMFVNYPVVTNESKVEKGMVLISKGWCRGKEISYFDMGLNPGNATIAYQPVDNNGKPNGTPVISAAPGSLAYTSFWKLSNVNLSSNEPATSISAIEKLRSASTNSTNSYVVVNRPLLPQNATPANGNELLKTDIGANLKGNSSSHGLITFPINPFTVIIALLILN